MIVCLSIPYFVAAVERRAGHGLDDEPLAVGGHPWEARPVYAYSQEAADRGVKPGMSLRLVQLLSPNAHFLPSAAPHYAQVSAEIVDVLADFSPDIEPQELWHSFPESALGATAHGYYLPARYCLDLEGLPPLEAVPFAQEMGKQVRGETNFAPAIGLSADKFTAQVAAAVCRPNHLLPVTAGDTAAFLAPRPLSFLPLGKEPARRLHLMGIKTLGQFALLPPSALREQFGSDIDRLHRLAQGQAGDPVQPRPSERCEIAQRDFDHPVDNALLLTNVLSHMAEELARRLHTAAWQGQCLHLTLETEDGRHWQQSLPLRQPTADAGRLLGALKELTAKADHRCGITRITAAVADLAPPATHQPGLFESPGGSSALHRAMQNLIAKYKTCGFYRPVLAEHTHPLPEKRFQVQTLAYDPTLA